ncbi:MAG TPA: hypothetical protein VM263_01730, partial [Acidimicrobiales bacterium]|nr:hypothetical protein [Acidimicrobiales bacterium]
RWAAARGLTVVDDPGTLNLAAAAGLGWAAAAGFERIVVAHADLPLAVELAWVARFSGVTIVPDRRDDGTNVIGVPTADPFPFSYGPGSFRRHARAALDRGIPLRVVREPRLGADVDVPADLASARLASAP